MIKNNFYMWSILLTIVFMSSIWGIDTAVTVLINHGYLINQYGVQNPNSIYHFSLLVNCLCFFIALTFRKIKDESLR